MIPTRYSRTSLSCYPSFPLCSYRNSDHGHGQIQFTCTTRTNVVVWSACFFLVWAPEHSAAFPSMLPASDAVQHVNVETSPWCSSTRCREVGRFCWNLKNVPILRFQLRATSGLDAGRLVRQHPSSGPNEKQKSGKQASSRCNAVNWRRYGFKLRMVKLGWLGQG